MRTHKKCGRSRSNFRSLLLDEHISILMRCGSAAGLGRAILLCEPRRRADCGVSSHFEVDVF